MARLPTPGGDSGNWGTILNTFLSQVHASDGTLKTDSVTSDAIAPNAVTSSALAPNAVDAITIADGSITETLLDTAVQTKLNATAPVTSVASKTGDVSLTKTDVGLDQVDNTSDATKNAATATLTNKTLTGPTINMPVIDTIKDTNGNTLLNFSSNASAVNWVNITNKPTGQDVTITGTGTDTNVDLDLRSKGSGAVRINGWVAATLNNTETLTNKTLTNPKIDTIYDSTFNTGYLASSVSGNIWIAPKGVTALQLTPVASSVNYFQMLQATTGNAPSLQATGSDTNVSLNLKSQGTGTIQANDVEVATISDTQTLTNKTISGSNNTITNIPASSLPDASRLVATTVYGSTGTEDGPNTWAKIATFSTGSGVFRDVQVVLQVVAGYGAYGASATILAFLRSGSGSNPVVGVKILSCTDSMAPQYNFPADAFKVISGGWTSDAELWMRKPTGYGQYAIYELSRFCGNGASLPVYNDGATWQSATPTGTVNNVSSDGVVSATGKLSVYATTGGTPTIAAIGDDTNKNLNITTKGTGTVKINNVDAATISDTQTLTNKTLVSPKIGTSILDTSGNILLSLAPYASAVNYLRLANRGTGLNPYLLVDGADSNIDLQINPKGSGGLMFYVTTGQTPTIKADGADANHNLNLVPKGTGTVKANGVDVVTISSTQTLTNKTINGTSNTITNLPASATPNAARLVRTHSTNLNQWYKILTLNAPAQDWFRFSGTYAVSTFAYGGVIFSVNMGTLSNPQVTGAVEILSKATNGVIGDDSFKIICDGYGQPFELWVKTYGGGSVLQYYEISQHGAGNITYDTSNTGQASEPTGSTLNVQSNGVVTSGIPIATTTSTQTLTNKTLSAPVINSPKIAAIYDTGNNPAWAYTTTASAVNYLTSGAGATGIGTSISATGSDTNININVFSKGTGSIQFRSVSNTLSLGLDHVTSGVNYLRLTNAATATAPTFTATGSDTNISVNIVPKGSGTVQANGVDIVTTTSTQSLSNKTLVTPVIYSGAGSAFLSTASDAADANLNIFSKGNSYVVLNNGYGVAFKANALASSVNFLQATATATGSAPVLYATGTDTNIGINLYPKGSGTVNVNGVDVVTVSGTQTLTNKTLTSPVVNQIMDTVNNGVVAVFTGSGASPTAYHRFYNAIGAGTATVLLTAEGSASNINQRFYLKGTGQFQIYIPTGQTTAIVSGIGADGNTNLNLTSQGTGVVQANGNTVLSGVAVPATATSSGKQHQVACDGSYIYYCIADNTWVRAAVASW